MVTTILRPPLRQHVLFDLDHVLSDASRRDHLIDKCLATDQWHEYHMDSVNDTVCRDLHELLTCFRHCDFHVIGITARPERYREITEKWCEDHRIHLDELLMHKRDMWEPSAELKIALAKERFGERFAEQILMIIDDHPGVIAAFRDAGVTALQVHGRKYG